VEILVLTRTGRTDCHLVHYRVGAQRGDQAGMRQTGVTSRRDCKSVRANPHSTAAAWSVKEDHATTSPNCDEERRFSVPTIYEKPALSFKSDYFKFHSNYLGRNRYNKSEVIVL
jgi:hypothetical protein